MGRDVCLQIVGTGRHEELQSYPNEGSMHTDLELRAGNKMSSRKACICRTMKWFRRFEISNLEYILTFPVFKWIALWQIGLNVSICDLSDGVPPRDYNWWGKRTGTSACLSRLCFLGGIEVETITEGTHPFL